MTKKSPLINHTGFTLVEILTAMVIFALGMLALYRLQIASIENNAYANQVTQASNLAQKKMEELFSQDYDSMNCTTEVHGIFQVECNPALGPGPGSQTTLIHVVVSWQDSKNVAHSVSLETIRAKTY